MYEGQACLAGLAVVFWKDVDEVCAMWQEDKVFDPDMPAAERNERTRNWRRALARSRDWIEPESEA